MVHEVPLYSIKILYYGLVGYRKQIAYKLAYKFQSKA